MSKTSKIVLGVIALVVIFFAGTGVKSLVPAKDVRLGGNSTLSGLNVQAINGDSFSVGTNTPQLSAQGPKGNLYAGGGFMQGGGADATSSAATANFLASDVIGYNLIAVTPTVGSITLTTPATSTLSVASTTNALYPGYAGFLPNTGDSTTIYIYNATSTAGQVLTIAGGTGCKMSIASSTAGATIALNPLKGASIEFVRLPNTDLACLVQPGV